MVEVLQALGMEYLVTRKSTYTTEESTRCRVGSIPGSIAAKYLSEELQRELCQEIGINRGQ